MARRAKMCWMGGLMLGLLILGCSDNSDESESAWSPQVTSSGDSSTAVEGLARRLPDDVLAFVATSGGDNLRDAFEQTILAKIWHDPGVQQFYQQIEQALLGKVRQEMGPEGSPIFDDVRAAVELALSRPIIVGAAQKDTAAGSPTPPIYGFLILDAGSKRSLIETAVEKLEAHADEGDIINIQVGNRRMHGPKDDDGVPGYWGWVDNYFVFAFNEGQGRAIEYLSSQVDRKEPAAVTALNKVRSSGDLLALHANIIKIRQLLESVIAQEDPEAPAKIKSALSSLGLNEVKSFTCRSGFAGADVVCSGLLEMPGPFTGLPACLKAADLVMLDMAEGKAFSASVCNVDLVGMYDTIMQTIQNIAPEEVGEVREGIAEFETEIGFRIRDDLLVSLTGSMVSYSLPRGVSIDAPNGGFVLICELKDAALMEKTLTTLAELVTAKSEGAVQVSTLQQDNITIHVWTIAPLAMMQITPAWAIIENHLVLASAPAIERAALAHISSPDRSANSIRSTEGYKQVTSNLPDNILSFTYNDAQMQFKQLMMALQQFWPMATMFAQQQNIHLPAMLPSLDSVIEQMGPACQFAWSDVDGIHLHCQGPFSNASLAGAAGVGVGAAVLMPALTRARQQAKNTVSLSNLRQISLGCIMYANDNQGKLPDDLKSLVPDYIPDEKIFESPLKPEGFDGPSYIYVTGLTMEMPEPQSIIIAYENPAYSTEFINVAFLDGHCEKIPLAKFQEMLESHQTLPEQQEQK